MKKHRQAKQFLDELRKTPNMSAVCNKLGLSRQTIYRWRKEYDFETEFEECLSQGTDNINDLAESKLIGKIQDGDTRSIIYWLENNHNKYRKPKPVFPSNDEIPQITEFNIYNATKKEIEENHNQVKPEEKSKGIRVPYRPR